MDPNEFIEFSKSASEFIVNYLENIRERNVLPAVKPGTLPKALPKHPPLKSEPWESIIKDFNELIMPAMAHWQSPNFHAYYPATTSYASILSDMFVAATNVVNVNWKSSPCGTELETIVMDWLAKLIGLPDIFLNHNNLNGGGVLVGSASESLIISMTAAREAAVKRYNKLHPNLKEHEIRARLIAYSTSESNCYIEKSSRITNIQLHVVPTNDQLCMTGTMLQEAIDEDLENGKFPFLCMATLGTTSTCAFDKIDEIGPICEKYFIWLHIDAAYAGAAFCCPEYRYLMKGIEYVNTLSFSPHKWLMMNIDVTAFWIKNSKTLTDTLKVDSYYLAYTEQAGIELPDYCNWQIPLGKKFRALKVWMVLRSFGVEKLQTHIRSHVTLIERFSNYIQSDGRFEIFTKSLGLIIFRLKGDCQLTRNLVKLLEERKKIFVMSTSIHGKRVIRFVIGGYKPENYDIDFAWDEIYDATNKLMCPSKMNGHETQVLIKDCYIDLTKNIQ